MKKIIQISLFIFFLNNICYSQDTSIIKFLPLQVGNIWVYYYSGFHVGDALGYERIQIVGTVMQNSKKYFTYSYGLKVLTGDPNANCYSYFQNSKPIRIDSTTGKIIQWEACGTGSGYLRDSLYAVPGNCYPDCAGFSPTLFLCRRDSGFFNIWGMIKEQKFFSNEPGMWYFQRRFVKDIGLQYMLESMYMHNIIRTLRGCVINGIVFGDTSYVILKINKLNSNIPESFSLFQNYPNPFNTSTNIRFSIPLDSRFRGNDKVVLKVFDLLGRELATLVNENLQPGTYEVTFDAGALSSGIYFYGLTAGNFSETKKLVLLK